MFTDKSLVHDYTRKMGPAIRTLRMHRLRRGLQHHARGTLRPPERVHNRFNAEVNGYFLCDRGRFGAGFVNSDKALEYPGLRQADGRYRALDHHEALLRMAQQCAQGRVAGSVTAASVEANHLLRQLVGLTTSPPASAIQSRSWSVLRCNCRPTALHQCPTSPPSSRLTRY